MRSELKVRTIAETAEGLWAFGRREPVYGGITRGTLLERQPVCHKPAHPYKLTMPDNLWHRPQTTPLP